MESFPILRVIRKTEWWKIVFKVLFSKGLLLSVSVLNLVIYIVSSFHTNKSDNFKSSEGEYSPNAGTFPVEQQSSPALMSSTNLSAIDESDLVSAREHLSKAKSRSEALKLELQQLNNLRFSLEESCRQKEREKSAVEDELEETELLTAIHIEELKNEKESLKSSLEKANKEKDSLAREVENCVREGMLTSFALKAHTVVIENLEKAREDLEKMEASLKELQWQRDNAVVLADKLVRGRVEKGKQNEESPFLNCGTLTRDSIWKEQFTSSVDSGSNMCVILERDIASNIKPGYDETHTMVKLGPVTGSIAFRNFVLSMIMDK